MIWLANLVTSGGYEYHRAKAEELFDKLEAEEHHSHKLATDCNYYIAKLLKDREQLDETKTQLHDARVVGQNAEARSVKWEQEYDRAFADAKALKLQSNLWETSHGELTAKADAWFQEIVELKGDRDAWEQSYWELNFTNKQQERAVTRLGDRIKVLESDKKTLNNAANNLLAERNELRDALEKTRTELARAKVNDRRGPSGRFIGRQG